MGHRTTITSAITAGWRSALWVENRKRGESSNRSPGGLTGKWTKPVKIDYFATSLPNFSIFDDDLEKRNRVQCLFLRGLGRVGQGDTDRGTADLKCHA